METHILYIFLKIEYWFIIYLYFFVDKPEICAVLIAFQAEISQGTFYIVEHLTKKLSTI